MLLKLSSSGFLEGLTSKREQVLDKASVCLALCRAEPGGGGATTSGKFPEQWGGGGNPSGSPSHQNGHPPRAGGGGGGGGPPHPPLPPPPRGGGGAGTRAAAHATISGSPKGQGCAVMLEGTPMSLFQGNE